jgi:hypothetical protein
MRTGQLPIDEQLGYWYEATTACLGIRLEPGRWRQQWPQLTILPWPDQPATVTTPAR